MIFPVVHEKRPAERRRTPRMSRRRVATLLCELADAARRFRQHVNDLLQPSQIRPWQPSANRQSRKA
jgi:hypothetical protein